MQFSSQQLALKERAAALSNGLLRKRGAEIDQLREYPWDVVEALKAERFMGMTIPEEYGGQGRSFLDTVLVIEEMARSCTVSARIVVEANKVTDDEALWLSRDVAKKIEAELQYPGQIKVTVIRETRAVEYAR